jgi:hypothetical protein
VSFIFSSSSGSFIGGKERAKTSYKNKTKKNQPPQNVDCFFRLVYFRFGSGGLYKRGNGQEDLLLCCVEEESSSLWWLVPSPSVLKAS